MRLAILIAAVLALYLWAAVLLGTVLRNRRRAAEERAQRVRDLITFMDALRGFGLSDGVSDRDIDRILHGPAAPYHAGRRLAA